MDRARMPMFATTLGLSFAMAVIALWAPARILANAGSHVLRPDKFVAIEVTESDAKFYEGIRERLRAVIQDLRITDLGTPGLTEPPRGKELASIDEAGALLGYRPLVPGFLPDGFSPMPSLTGYTAGTASMALDVPKLRQVVAKAGLQSIHLPDSYDGARVTLDTWPAVMAYYSNPKASLFVATAQTRPPALTVEGKIDLESLRNQVLESGVVPTSLAAQLRALTDWTTTLPVPIPEGSLARTVQLRGTSVLFITLRGGESLALWYEHNGTMAALWTNLPPEIAIRVVESLH
jgi:hypothetical protein